MKFSHIEEACCADRLIDCGQDFSMDTKVPEEQLGIWELDTVLIDHVEE